MHRELLTFAHEHRPRHFDPDQDVEIYDENQEIWKPLQTYSYPLADLVGPEARNGASSPFRLASEEAETYLEYCKGGEIGEKLHAEDGLDRSQLLALVEAGYTSVDDLLGTADTLDIERETGVDRDVVQSVGTKHVGGFSSGGSFTTGGQLAGLEPLDEFDGWELTVNTTSRIRWTTAGGFQLTVTPAPDGTTTITTNAPDDHRHSWHRKGWSPSVGDGKEPDPETALLNAHKWLADNELVFADDLEAILHVGPATAHYLTFEYDVNSYAALSVFIEAHPEEFEAIFGEFAEEVKESLKELREE